MVKWLIKSTNSFPELAAWYFIALGIASVIFHLVERISLFDSFYWAVITSLSIGYGDISPKTVVGKIDAIVLALITLLFVIPRIIALILDVMHEDKHKFTDEEQRNILKLLNDINDKV